MKKVLTALFILFTCLSAVSQTETKVSVLKYKTASFSAELKYWTSWTEWVTGETFTAFIPDDLSKLKITGSQGQDINIKMNRDDGVEHFGNIDIVNLTGTDANGTKVTVKYVNNNSAKEKHIELIYPEKIKYLFFLYVK